MNFNSILIGSADPARLTEFYTRVFGSPAFDMGGYTGWAIGSGFITVGPHDQVSGSNGEPGRLIWNIETGDVQGEFDRMKAAGATVVREPYDPGEGSDQSGQGLIATFADVDGNYFQLMSPMSPDPAG